MPRSSFPHLKRAFTLCLLGIIFLLPGCGKKQKIPYHPIMGMVSRNIERYELVPLIITEHERALAVQEVLYEVWRLGRSFNEQRNREFFELLASEANESPANWAAAASARRVNQHELILWQEYRMLMLRLRTLLTCDEYRRLLGSNGFEMRKEASCSGQL